MKLLYRQKIFLALLEIFKNNLEKIDFVKLVFLYCQYQKKEFYSFFPYHYGCFSFDLYKDKRIFTECGILNATDNFSLSKPLGMLYQLEEKDKYSLIEFSKKIGSLRGDALIRKTYLEFPEYTKRSIIKERILAPQEQEALQELALFVDPNNAIYTIGYEGISIDEYLRKLINNDISIIVDVRKNPKSMKFDFNSKALTNFLSKVNIEYVGIPDLGIPATMRADLNSFESYQALFDIYETKILSKQTANVEKIANLVKSGQRVALTCFEKNNLWCHRSRVARKLNSDYNYEIVNL
jgi:hypothetical protein